MNFFQGLTRKVSNARCKVKRICSETGNLAKLRKLVESYPALNLPKQRFLCASKGFMEVAAYLIDECGVDVNELSGTGFTALHVACNRSNVEMSNYLIYKGARLDIKDHTGKIPLECFRSVALKQLVVTRVDPARNPYTEAIPIEVYREIRNLLAETGDVSRLRDILKKNDSIHVPGLRFDGVTALQLCASGGFVDVARYLIEECRVDVNEVSGDGFSALHIACNCDKIDMAQYLVLEGATLDKKDRNGATPMDLCRSVSVRYTIVKGQGGPAASDVHVTYETKDSTPSPADSPVIAAAEDAEEEDSVYLEVVSPLSIAQSKKQDDGASVGCEPSGEEKDEDESTKTEQIFAPFSVGSPSSQVSYPSSPAMSVHDKIREFELKSSPPLTLTTLKRVSGASTRRSSAINSLAGSNSNDSIAPARSDDNLVAKCLSSSQSASQSSAGKDNYIDLSGLRHEEEMVGGDSDEDTQKKRKILAKKVQTELAEGDSSKNRGESEKASDLAESENSKLLLGISATKADFDSYPRLVSSYEMRPGNGSAGRLVSVGSPVLSPLTPASHPYDDLSETSPSARKNQSKSASEAVVAEAVIEREAVVEKPPPVERNDSSSGRRLVHISPVKDQTSRPSSTGSDGLISSRYGWSWPNVGGGLPREDVESAFDISDEGGILVEKGEIESRQEQMSFSKKSKVEKEVEKSEGGLIVELSPRRSDQSVESRDANTDHAIEVASSRPDAVDEAGEEDSLVSYGACVPWLISDGGSEAPLPVAATHSALSPPRTHQSCEDHDEHVSDKGTIDLDKQDARDDDRVALHALLDAAVDEKAQLLARISRLEEEATEAQLAAQHTCVAAAQAEQLHEEEAVQFKIQLELVRRNSKRIVDEKEEVNMALTAELELVKGEAGVGARLATSLRESLEHRALEAMVKLEIELQSEGSVRTAAEERVRFIESERELDILSLFAGEDIGSVLTPVRGERQPASLLRSPGSLLALSASPSTMASLHILYRNIGILLDGEEQGASSLEHPPSEGDHGWVNTGSTVDDRDIDKSPRGARNAHHDVPLAFEDIYPSPDMNLGRLPVRCRSMSAIDGNDWESSEPNPLHRAVSKPSSPRQQVRKPRKATEIEGLGSLFSRVKSKDIEPEVRLEKIYPSADEGDEGSSSNALHCGMTAEETRKREDDDGDELVGSSVLRDMDRTDRSLFGEVEEGSVDEGSSTVEMSGTENLIPLPRKDRRRSFRADEQNLMLKLDNSLCSIYSSLERLRVRNRVAALASPSDNSLLHSDEMGKKIEAWLRLSQFTLSRDDLLALGPFPIAIQSLMKQNEGVLWAMFRCYYPPNCRVLLSVAPSDNSNSRNEYRRRVLSLSSIWDLLRDFNICPDLCTMIGLIESTAAITGNSSILSPDQSHTQLLLSFDSFLKLLWRIAVDYLTVASTASPRARMLALLERMDASSGRVRNLRKQRSLSLADIPPLILTEQTSERRAAKVLGAAQAKIA